MFYLSRSTPQVGQQTHSPESQHTNSLQPQAEPLFTDINDPVKYVGKKLTDDEKLSLLYKCFRYSFNIHVFHFKW